VALELAHQGLVVQVPDRNVPVAAAAEAHLGVGADGQGVAGRGGAGELSLDPGCGGSQVPDRQGARLSSHNQGSTIRQQLDGPDVVVSGETIQLRDRSLSSRLANIPDLDTSFATSVDILGGIGHGNSADNISMGQGVDLPGMARDSRAQKRILREGDGSLLAVSANVERIGPVK
jgi:hypothetical protein